MEQSDYLKRQIEQIGVVLGGLLNRLLGRNPMAGDSAVQEVCDELKEELDIDIDSYLGLDSGTIIEKLQARGFDYALLLQFSKLLSFISDTLPAGDPRKQRLQELSSDLSVKIQKTYSTINLTFF